MRKHALNPEGLTVESFAPFTDEVDTAGTCICDIAPCGCTRAADCTA